MERALAILLSIAGTPWLLLSIGLRAFRAGELGRLEQSPDTLVLEWHSSVDRLELGLWSVALGHLRLTGPAHGTEAAQQFPSGLYSPAQLQADMGLAGEGSDVFIERALPLPRLTRCGCLGCNFATRLWRRR